MNVLCASTIKTKGGIGMAPDISILRNATSDGKGDVMQECSMLDLLQSIYTRGHSVRPFAQPRPPIPDFAQNFALRSVRSRRPFAQSQVVFHPSHYLRGIAKNNVQLQIKENAIRISGRKSVD